MQMKNETPKKTKRSTFVFFLKKNFKLLEKRCACTQLQLKMTIESERFFSKGAKFNAPRNCCMETVI